VRVSDAWVERDGRCVVEGISFSVRPGQFVGVVGPNGAGKTTLLRAILGLVPLSRGHIEVLGGEPGASGGVGYVPQRQAAPQGFPARVEDVVAMGLLRRRRRLRRLDAAARSEVALNLERVGLTPLARRPVGQLSGGEERRVLLAQALCASTRLLVLDEPTIGLDLPAEHEFYGLLRQLQQELSLAVIGVSHDLVALAGEVDSLICINRRMHIHGNPEDVVHSHAIREAYSCEFDFLAGELAHHEGRARTPEE
jgi:ABC-type Mn2+/Zn2+ transport system ATPase subunit